MTDIVYVDGSDDSVPLELLEYVVQEACRVAGISQRTNEREGSDVTRLRLRLVRGILEAMLRGERDPARLRVIGLRSTFYCCVSNDVAGATAG
jgi:hypothetical protein